MPENDHRRDRILPTGEFVNERLSQQDREVQWTCDLWLLRQRDAQPFDGLRLRRPIRTRFAREQSFERREGGVPFKLGHFALPSVDRWR